MSSSPKLPSGPTALVGEDLLKHVRQAAAALVAQLAEGERATQGWSHEAQTQAIVEQAAADLLERLSQTGCWGEANRVPSSELWRIAGDWLQTGALQSRARFKPRGYAGDFEMLAQICDNWRCDHPLGRAFDAFFQYQTAPQAVRHRTGIVARAIALQCRRNPAAECHVVSVGSGPARDVELAFTTLTPDERKRMRVTLVDLDPAALEYAAARLAPLLAAERLTCARENLFRLARYPRVTELLLSAQLISCVGFFDYLPDRDAVALLAHFWRMLRPGCRLLVFNFTPDNPSRAYMEWIGNWYLIYRSRIELAELAHQAGLPADCVHISAEELGVDAFMSAEKL